MEAISYITRWTNWLLLIVPVGAGCMISYFAFQKSVATDGDDIGHYGVRIKQTIKGSIIAITISGMINIIKAYYL